MGSMELLAIPIKVGAKAPQKVKLDRAILSCIPPRCSRCLHKCELGRGKVTHKTAPQNRDSGKTRPNFQRRGLTVENPRFKSNKELILLITNNCQDQLRVSRGACIAQAQYTN